jgi:hypothetical protein
MTTSSRHAQVEHQFRALLASADLPEPDDTARLQRALIFLWYESKAFVLIDLDEMPENGDPLAGFDVDMLRADVLGGDYFPPGFAAAG